MKKVVWSVFALFLLAGCAGPRYQGFSSLENYSASKVNIVSNPKINPGFQAAIESWLKENKLEYSVVQEGTRYDLDRITIEYSGQWKAQIAVYLSVARITAMQQGQRVAQVDYAASKSLGTSKFGSAEGRIKYMMDVLFKKKTADEATRLVNGQ